MNALLPLFLIVLLFVVACDRSGTIEPDHSVLIANCENLNKTIVEEQWKDEARRNLTLNVVQLEPSDKNELKSCQQNIECTFVPKNCFWYLGIGKPAVINVKFLDYYRTKLERCEDSKLFVYAASILYYLHSEPFDESSYYWQQNHKPVCQENQCSIKKVPIQQDLYDCYFDAAVLLDNVTLCEQINDKDGCIYEVAKHSENPDLCKDVLTKYPGCYNDVLCNGGGKDCVLKVKEQIRKDFPELSTAFGKYGVCFNSLSVEREVLLVENKKNLSEAFGLEYYWGRPHAISRGGVSGRNELHCSVAETDTPLFLVSTPSGFSRGVGGCELIDSVYYNGTFYTTCNTDLANLSFYNSISNLVAFKDDYKSNTFDYELYQKTSCPFEPNIYDWIIEASKTDLNVCFDLDNYLEKNTFFGFKNECRDLLRQNFRIKCFDSYGLNRGDYDSCVSLSCKIETASNLSVCKDLYPDTNPEQAACKLVIGYKIAQRTLNAEYCKYIPGLYGDLEPCVSTIANKTVDKKACLFIPKDLRRFNCYYNVALSELQNNITGIPISEIEQSEQCEQYEENHLKQRCFKFNAIIEGNISFCASLGEGTAASKCYKEIAVMHKKPELCEKAWEHKEECWKAFGN